MAVPGSKAASARTVAENIIRKHKKDGFQRLITLFQEGASSAKIVAVFGVSRQRVNQWKTALGQETVTFEPNADIVDLLPRPESRTSRRTAV